MKQRVVGRNSQGQLESQPLKSPQFQISKRICAEQTSGSVFELFIFVGVGKADLERCFFQQQAVVHGK